MKPRVNVIAAVAPDGAIGRKGDLLFHVSADLRRFKALTMGHPVIMGRKTFESLPKGALPGRRNVVVSRNTAFHAPGVEVFPSLEAAVAACGDAGEVFVIGGAQIYAQAVAMADRLCLTRFDRTLSDADCFFPEVSTEQWTVVESSEWSTDEKSGVRFRFDTLERRK